MEMVDETAEKSRNSRDGVLGPFLYLTCSKTDQLLARIHSIFDVLMSPRSLVLLTLDCLFLIKLFTALQSNKGSMKREGDDQILPARDDSRTVLRRVCLCLHGFGEVVNRQNLV